MGRFRTDRASVMALETSVDGERWIRREIPKVVDGIRWKDGLPEENANGDVDLWVNARGLTALRLVGLGESLTSTGRSPRSRSTGGRARGIRDVLHLEHIRSAGTRPRRDRRPRARALTWPWRLGRAVSRAEENAAAHSCFASSESATC